MKQPTRNRTAIAKCFDAFPMASMILAVALILGCVRSYFVRDELSMVRVGLKPSGEESYKTDTWGFSSSHGNVGFSRSIQEGVIGAMNAEILGPSALDLVPPSTSFHWDKTMPYAIGFEGGWRGSSAYWAGFVVGRQYFREAIHGEIVSYVIIPYWFAILVPGAIAFAGAFWKRRDRRRLSGGLCARCGYDLRATPQRCPECGTIPGAAPA